MEKNTAAEGDRNERKKTRDNARRLSGGGGKSGGHHERDGAPFCSVFTAVRLFARAIGRADGGQFRRADVCGYFFAVFYRQAVL